MSMLFKMDSGGGKGDCGQTIKATGCDWNPAVSVDGNGCSSGQYAVWQSSPARRVSFAASCRSGVAVHAVIVARFEAELVEPLLSLLVQSLKTIGQFGAPAGSTWRKN
ncbi:hypothetical protein OO17_07115 [Rhodopseudomonas palustris]|uniref:Uncharacterized protein n=1 Tax=Rhodopseudomonas palustris TaxID=1076 RepID=A0A0D7EYY5_RHOPL|nr:hypothetical protein OO17_07115 [Rhodopseudomonas palustris]